MIQWRDNIRKLELEKDRVFLEYDVSAREQTKV